MPERRLSPSVLTLRRLLHHRLFMTGLVLFVISCWSSRCWRHGSASADPNQLAMRYRFLSPSPDHLFGTDNFGRSLLFARDLGRAAVDDHRRVGGGDQRGASVPQSVRRAGYFRRIDNVLMRLNDALMAFPAVLLAIGVTAVLGPSLNDVIIALGVVYTPRTARIVRSSVIVLREMEYVQAAVAAGAGHWRILRRHILPNAMAPLIVQLSFLFAYAVLTEATLSFLGVGAVPPTPTWGNIMAEGRQYMIDAPWIIAIPGVALMITVLGLNLLGDGLRDVLDPRLRIQQ